MLALAEPELVSNFSVSSKPTEGTVSLYAGDEPAADGTPLARTENHRSTGAPVPQPTRPVILSTGVVVAIVLAAASLGASRARTLWHVVLPLIKTGIVAGAVFAFVHSFTDVNLSLFLVRPGEQPITVKILGFLEYGFAPTLAAVSVITLLVPLALVAIVERMSGLGDFIYAARERG